MRWASLSMLGAQAHPVVKRRKGRFLCLFLNWHTYFLFLDFRSNFEKPHTSPIPCQCSQASGLSLRVSPLASWLSGLQAWAELHSDFPAFLVCRQHIVGVLSLQNHVSHPLVSICPFVCLSIYLFIIYLPII